MNSRVDVAVIGAGPAGLAAATGAREAGARSVTVFERAPETGGILLQCPHNGFGAEFFQQDLPGPSYAHLWHEKAVKAGVNFETGTTVLGFDRNRRLKVVSPDKGCREIQAGAIVLAMGCRERTRPQIEIGGNRPAGVYTAGLVQYMVNRQGYIPGRRYVILGSGDIGMIMARRLTLEGAHVAGVFEALPFLTGLRRNYSQCLADFGIPLTLSHTVTRVIGRKRLEGVETMAVDEALQPIAGTEKIIECDTLLLSVGLIPENELTRQAGIEIDPLTGGPLLDMNHETSQPGVFACGNVTAIYDLADWVSIAGLAAGKSAALSLTARQKPPAQRLTVKPGPGIRMVLPRLVDPRQAAAEGLTLQYRVAYPFEHPVKIGIQNGGHLVKLATLPYARPAEMLQAALKPGECESLTGNELTISALTE